MLISGFILSACNNSVYITTEKGDSKLKELIASKVIDMPVLELNGNMENISKENKVIVTAHYVNGEQNINCFATIKYQGASSLSYPKKNYNIQFYKDENLSKKNKVTIVDDWGKQSKYCLKANWVDYSQSRNIVSAKLYGQVVHSRNLDDELTNLVNGGAIDGFPVIVFLNDGFLGLYTFNIPKDNWCFNMNDDTLRQAILMADDWTNSVKLQEPINLTNLNGWDLEYCSTEDTDTGWVEASFNQMINFINNNDDISFTNGISTYIDIDRAIDTMIHTYFICADDNTSKNILWVTYDGVKWHPSCYDMDGTWGLKWNGKEFRSASTYMLPETIIESNVLFSKLYSNYYDNIVNRWNELRQNIYTIENITSLFTNFENLINNRIRQYEKLKWPTVPNQEQNNIQQIIDFATIRLQTFDLLLTI